MPDISIVIGNAQLANTVSPATMAFSSITQSKSIPETAHSHPHDPIPQEPASTRRISVAAPDVFGQSPSSIVTPSNGYSDASSVDSVPSTPGTEHNEDPLLALDEQKSARLDRRKRRASTMLVSENSEDIRRILGEESSTTMIKNCCGGGCCKLQEILSHTLEDPVLMPENDAFRSLGLKLGALGIQTELTEVVDLPQKTVTFSPLDKTASIAFGDTEKHPPKFVTPHPPYEVFSAPLFHARELTKPGAEKRTYHFDLDVTDYPAESGDVDFVVGGAIGVCAPNAPEVVDQIFDLLAVPRFARDKKVLLKTSNGRWPTIWGDEQPRELVTTRRELLTWCSDVQSYPPTKQLLRLLAEYAESEHEQKILMYLSSAQGQASFCDLRTGSYITLLQLLSAFPSSRPPLDHLLSVLKPLMPRFYSLSQDPQVSRMRDGSHCRRLIEIAVTVHETHNFTGGSRTGVGSGFLERLARQVIAAEKAGKDPRELDLRVPMFRGLMANPLAREFVSDGPMLLIGAGVGIAPFRGFVHKRLKSANCANKVWVLQGIRDSLLDELYSGDWGVHEDKVKKVVQSRRGEAKYVQDEVRAQADLVWFIINALDGRIFVCGSSKGMGEGVEAALVDVAVAKGNLNLEEAKAFWEEKKRDGRYIAETW
jgi:sulfite reductase alpha subunit-like flavoprotein